MAFSLPCRYASQRRLTRSTTARASTASGLADSICTCDLAAAMALATSPSAALRSASSSASIAWYWAMRRSCTAACSTAAWRRRGIESAARARVPSLTRARLNSAMPPPRSAINMIDMNAASILLRMLRR